jgi:hypothetical protein
MIPVEQLAPLAELYDRYNNAFDPLSQDCREAKAEFDQTLASLHAAHAADLKFSDFRIGLIRNCRDYLRKNRPV